MSLILKIVKTQRITTVYCREREKERERERKRGGKRAEKVVMQYILLYQQSMYSLPSLKLHTCCLSLHNTTSYFHKTLRKKTKVSRHTEKAFMGITSPSANVLGITTDKVFRTASTCISHDATAESHNHFT